MTRAGLFVFLTVVGSTVANGTTIDGTTPASTVLGTSSGAWADGYGEPISSSFRVNFLVLGNETKSSTPLLFKDVPYTTVTGTRYFAFVYDSQETSQQRRVSIDDVTITVGGQTIWSSNEPIILNAGLDVNNTLTPLGNGADFALYIPVSLFDNRGLSGNSTFLFTSTQSDSHNGNDEWIFTDAGVVGTVLKFNENDPINSGTAAVPEPGSAVLVMLGGAGALLRRRCRH
jgi:hypothetical protein